ncbi:hypothetical protein ACFLZM_01120 [Thermodesulfobacteriota bacterium]
MTNMNDAETDSLKEVAWNGIRLMTPLNWEIGKIGARYLFFENESGPLLEIKWNTVGEKFSHADQFRKLSEFKRKIPEKKLHRFELPIKLAKALGDYQTTGFSWCSDKMVGTGVILYCSVCRKAALIQFFFDPSQESNDIFLNILRSFRDHRNDDQIIWSVFDIRAVVPKIYRLERFRFEPGRFRLDFYTPGQRLFLHRWAPALTLLEKKDFSRFASKQFDLSGGVLHATTINGCDAVKWEGKSSGAFWERLIQKEPFRLLRLWHLTKKNRIHGVWVEGKKPIDADLLTTICADYESL